MIILNKFCNEADLRQTFSIGKFIREMPFHALKSPFQQMPLKGRVMILEYFKEKFGQKTENFSDLYVHKHSFDKIYHFYMMIIN